MIFNSKTKINVDGTPTDVSTGDSFSFIPNWTYIPRGVYVCEIVAKMSNYDDEYKGGTDYVIPSGVSSELCRIGGNSIFLYSSSAGPGLAELTMYWNGVIMAGGLRVKTTDTTVTVTATDLGDGTWSIKTSDGSKTYISNTSLPGFDGEDDKVSIGRDAHTGSGRGFIDVSTVTFNDEVFDLKEASSGAEIVGSFGTIGTINSNYSRPSGTVFSPNYATKEDYINGEVRYDAVPSLKKTKLIINSPSAPIEGASVVINGEAPVLTNKLGEVEYENFGGDYSLDVTASGYADIVGSTLNVGFQNSIDRRTLALDEIANKTEIISTKTTNNDLSGIAGVVNQVVVRSDGTKQKWDGAQWNPYYGNLSSSIRVFNTLVDLKKSTKSVLGQQAETLAYYDDIPGGGALYLCVSTDVANSTDPLTGLPYVDNGGNIIVTSMGDVYQFDKVSEIDIEASKFGLRGVPGEILLEENVQSLFDYAARYKLKIQLKNGGDYFIDSLTETEVLRIGYTNFERNFFHLEGNGSIIRRWWQVRAMPYVLRHKELIGTYTSLEIDETNNVNFHNYKTLTYDSNGVPLTRKVFYTYDDEALPGTEVVDDYVINAVDDSTSIRKVKSVSPTVLMIDSAQSEATTLSSGGENDYYMRDRFFIGNADLSKRIKINGALDNATLGAATVRALRTAGLEFDADEELFFYVYDAYRAAGSTIDNIYNENEVIQIPTEIVYKTRSETLWKQYIGVTVPNNAIIIYRSETFKINNVIFDDARDFADSIHLNESVSSNYGNSETDQKYPTDAYRYFGAGFAGVTIANSNYEITNVQIKNNEWRLMKHTEPQWETMSYDNIKFYDAWPISHQGHTSIYLKYRLTYIRINNIRVDNPYSHYYKNGGVNAVALDQKVTNLYLNNSTARLFGYGSVSRQNVDGVTMNQCMSKKLSTSSPFWTGKILPVKNGGTRHLIAKAADTGYFKNGFMAVNNLRIPELTATGNILIDLDPVTGCMQDVEKDNVVFTKSEDGSGNFFFSNSDIISSMSLAGPNTSNTNPQQKVGGRNYKFHRCTFKFMYRSNPNDYYIGGTDIIDCDAMNMSGNDGKIIQHQFSPTEKLGENGSFHLSGDLIKNFRSTISLRLNAFNTSQSKGHFYENKISDSYYFTRSLGQLDEESSAELPLQDSLGNIAYVPYKSLLTTYYIGGGIGEIVMPVNPTDGDTVTLDGVLYTFQSTLTPGAGNVKIGSTALETRNNLKAAMNVSGTEGVEYGAGTIVHPTMIAVRSDYDSLTWRAKTKLPEDANWICSQSFTSDSNTLRILYNAQIVTWLNPGNGQTITIGSVVYTYKSNPLDPNDIDIGSTIAKTWDNLIRAINGTGIDGTTQGPGTVAHPDVTAEHFVKYNGQLGMNIENKDLTTYTFIGLTTTAQNTSKSGSSLDTFANYGDGICSARDTRYVAVRELRRWLSSQYKDIDGNTVYQDRDEMQIWSSPNIPSTTTYWMPSTNYAYGKGSMKHFINIKAPGITLGGSVDTDADHHNVFVVENCDNINVANIQPTIEGTGVNNNRIIFKNCTFNWIATYQQQTKQSTSWLYPYYYDANIAKPLGAGNIKQTLDIYENCFVKPYANALDLNPAHEDALLIPIDWSNQILSTASQVQTIHPQVNHYQVPSGQTFDLDGDLTEKLRFMNDKATFFIQLNTGGAFTYDGETFNTPGRYTMQVTHTYDLKVIQSSVLSLIEQKLSEPKDVTGTTYTLSEYDTKVKFTNELGCEVTLPSGFADYSSVELTNENVGTGDVTFVAGEGAVISSNVNIKMHGGALVIPRVFEDVWDLNLISENSEKFFTPKWFQTYDDNIDGVSKYSSTCVLTHDAVNGWLVMTSDNNGNSGNAYMNHAGAGAPQPGVRYRFTTEVVGKNFVGPDVDVVFTVGWAAAGQAEVVKNTADIPFTLTSEFTKNDVTGSALGWWLVYMQGVQSGEQIFMNNARVEIISEVTGDPVEIATNTYTFKPTDRNLRFTHPDGCLVTLPQTTKVGQLANFYNYCGVGQNVVFQDDGVSSIVIDTALTLEYGKYSEIEVIEDDVYSLKGDLI